MKPPGIAKMVRERGDCPVCGSPDTFGIVPPHRSRSMTSDGRVRNVRMEKRSCRTCGQGFLENRSEAFDREGLFGADYTLGLADLEAGEMRARGYAERIEDMVVRHHPAGKPVASIVEFGSATGALLAELSQRWPVRNAIAVEPSPALADMARRRLPASIEVIAGFAEDVERVGDGADICISVNVIEHASDPVAFLRACRTVLADDGLAVVICPDGERPNLELLFLDHVSSATTESLTLAGAKAGLALVETSVLPGAQSDFRISSFRPSSSQAATEPAGPFPELAEARERFVAGWRGLEAELQPTLRATAFGIFGLGEFADLLNAYVPAVADHARIYVADRPTEESKCGRPVIDTEMFARNPRMPLLAAVHPRHWRTVKSKLEAMRLSVFHPYQFSDLKAELQ